MTEIETRSTFETQRSHAEQQARPGLENWRQEAEDTAVDRLDEDARTAIDLTVRTIDAITANKPKEALQLMESATGKIDIVLARNPKLAWIPAYQETLVIDSAPASMSEIKRRADLAETAVTMEDYPGARSLLDGLRSEIRIRTWLLPLADFPIALRDAASLIDKDRDAAARGLLAALRTLVASDRVLPIPLLLAEESVEHAQMLAARDKEAAQEELERARFALSRAKALGYRRQDSEYESLKSQIENLRKQLRGSGDTSSGFHRLKETLGLFLKRQLERRAGSGEEASSKAA